MMISTLRVRLLGSQFTEILLALGMRWSLLSISEALAEPTGGERTLKLLCLASQVGHGLWTR